MSTASYQLPRSKHSLTGLAWVLVLHGLLFWAVHVGLTRNVVNKMPTVVQALLLTDTRPEPPPPVTPPPPPPPPPKPTPSPPSAPTPPTLKPASSPAPAAPPVPLAPALELPAVMRSTPTNTGLTATPPPAPAAPPAAASAPSVPSVPSSAAPATPAPTPVRTAAGVNVNQCDKPEYPSASRRLEEEGTVALRFLVGVDGKVIQSEVEKSSGFKRLDEAARAGLSKCQFRPALVDGKPEQAWASMKYTWRLE